MSKSSRGSSWRISGHGFAHYSGLEFRLEYGWYRQPVLVQLPQPAGACGAIQQRAGGAACLAIAPSCSRHRR